MIFRPIAAFLGYDYYLENLDFMKEITIENNTGSGLAIILFFIIDGFVIYYYEEMKKSIDDVLFSYYYAYFFVGVILSRIFEDNFILSRIADYFVGFRLLILAYLFSWLFKRTGKNVNVKIILGLFLILGMVAYYYKAIYNNAADIAPYKSIFF
jgi:hypothetical protein